MESYSLITRSWMSPKIQKFIVRMSWEKKKKTKESIHWPKKHFNGAFTEAVFWPFNNWFIPTQIRDCGIRQSEGAQIQGPTYMIGIN